MKLFPASCGGPSYLRALRGPFPTIALMPTGGVRIDEVQAYLERERRRSRSAASSSAAPRRALTPSWSGSPRRPRARPRRCATARCRRRRAPDAALRPRDAGAHGRSRRDRAEHRRGCRPTATSTGWRCGRTSRRTSCPSSRGCSSKAGAVGITCQKLGEAEVMADAGFDDILLSFPLVGEAKAERLAALAERVKMTVVGDSAVVAEGSRAGARPARASRSTSWSNATRGSGGRASRPPRRRPSWPSSSTGSRACASPG